MVLYKSLIALWCNLILPVTEIMPSSRFIVGLGIALLLANPVYPATTPPQRNDGISLAVSPNCGSLAGAPADVNAGLLPLAAYRTLVTFGVSWTDLHVYST